MSKHTKGPWFIEADTDTIPEAEANARLIAAAPELLIQLKILNELLAKAGYGSGGTELDDEAVNTALLIAKAEGKGE